MKIMIGGRQGGKTVLARKMMAAYTRQNPQAIIAEVGPGGKLRIEKPVPPEYYQEQRPAEIKLLTYDGKRED